MEKRVQQVRLKKGLSFYDSRNLVEISQSAMVVTLYAAQVKATKRSVFVNSDLTWQQNHIA